MVRTMAVVMIDEHRERPFEMLRIHDHDACAIASNDCGLGVSVADARAAARSPDGREERNLYHRPH